MEIEFVNGKKNGSQIEYRKNNTKMVETIFQDDEVKRIKSFDGNGNQIQNRFICSFFETQAGGVYWDRFVNVESVGGSSLKEGIDIARTNGLKNCKSEKCRQVVATGFGKCNIGNPDL